MSEIQTAKSVLHAILTEEKSTLHKPLMYTNNDFYMSFNKSYRLILPAYFSKQTFNKELHTHNHHYLLV